MAVDLISTPFSSEANLRPTKRRRRLGWDVPDPAFAKDMGVLQMQLVSKLYQEYASSTNSVEIQANWIGERLTSKKDHQIDLDPVSNAEILCKQSRKWPSDAVAQSSRPLGDDKDGHLNFHVGDYLTSRYIILQKMGEGTFGRVLECMDVESHEIVAIKVVRSTEKYREDAMIEIGHLQTIGRNDKSGCRGCVQMRRWFDYRNHICIVFEKLGPSLYDFLQNNGFQPFSIECVRAFGRQLLESLAYMHELGLIHTDLKPENILLVSSEFNQTVGSKNTSEHCNMKKVPKSNKIKLIDFGSTTYDKECSFSVVSTRHYRAPEVILGSGWSYPCDIWSVACILVELCSGKVLFQTHENLEHLAMMERVFGPIPSYLVRRLKGKGLKYFKHERRLVWPDRYTSRESIRAVDRMPILSDLLENYADSSSRSLLDLLERMFCFDPVHRITAKEALQHSFFKQLDN